MSVSIDEEKLIKDTLDADKLIEYLFKSNRNRNDLAIGIQNDTGGECQVNYHINHGNLKKVSTKGKIKEGEVWKAGVEAKGAGSNIVLNITMPNKSGWMVMAATPVNKENYFKVSTNKHGYDSPNHSMGSKDKHYSSDGYYEKTANGYHMSINITGDSPATCKILLSKS